LKRATSVARLTNVTKAVRSEAGRSNTVVLPAAATSNRIRLKRDANGSSSSREVVTSVRSGWRSRDRAMVWTFVMRTRVEASEKRSADSNCCVDARLSSQLRTFV
jgi:hypothetical protein